MGGASLIGRAGTDDETVKRVARRIVEATERGASVTRRLLSFARRGDLRAEPVAVAALLEGLRDMLTPVLGPAIDVRITADPDLPPLFADRGQLETVLVNLATNGRDAMPGGGTLTLAALAETRTGGDGPGPVPGRYIRLSVTDTGTGMDAATLARATEPFFTTKKRGEGTGLGLAMARGFIEQSGGSVTIDSAEGRGTRVTVWLPQTGTAPLPRPGEAEADLVRAADRSCPTVLLVDDEALVRDVLGEQLAEAGFGVVTAATGAEALCRLEGAPAVACLITDLSMPGIDGLTLIQEARARRPDLPAILLTGYAEDRLAAVALPGLETGFLLLYKPIREAELVAGIRRLSGADAVSRPPAGHQDPAPPPPP
jgi:CheY-like chemotaxis protein